MGFVTIYKHVWKKQAAGGLIQAFEAEREEISIKKIEVGRSSLHPGSRWP
jgi:hypothetical protein